MASACGLRNKEKANMINNNLYVFEVIDRNYRSEIIGSSSLMSVRNVQLFTKLIAVVIYNAIVALQRNPA